MKIVDLSRELYHRTPAYPGQPPIIHGIWKTHEEAFVESGNVQGNSVMFFSMPDHGGTHIDAPRHFGKTGQPINYDLGFVGDPDRVNPSILSTIIHSDAIPVIAPIGVGEDGETYNVNADMAAGAIAAAVQAKRLLLLTDVAGVLDSSGKLIEELSIGEVPRLIERGVITGGMIPKVRSCVDVVEAGVEGVVIVDGRVPHCVLIELLTPHGVGTRISRPAPNADRDAGRS